MASFRVIVYDDEGDKQSDLSCHQFTEAQRRGILHMVANAGVEAVWPSAEKGLDYEQFEPDPAHPNQGILEGLQDAATGRVVESQGQNLGSVGHAKQVVALSPEQHAEMVIRTPKLVLQPAGTITADQINSSSLTVQAEGLLRGGAPPATPVTEGGKRELARASGYTGDLCQQCGSDRMRRNGSCLLCEGCGSTTGCS